MGINLDADNVAAYAVAAGAIAAAVSAWNSRRAITLGMRPLVYAEAWMRQEESDSRWYISGAIYSDGAVAIDVECWAEQTDGPWVGDRGTPVRSLGSGVRHPPKEGSTIGLGLAPPVSAKWHTVTRYRDRTGMRFETRNQRDPPRPLVTRRVRRGPLGRVQRWRMRRRLRP